MSATNDSFRRGNSIIVKNLPTDYDTNKLGALFSQFGRIVSTKVLPNNPNYEGGCGFVNFADAESCTQAVEQMNNTTVNGFTLCVAQSGPRMGGYDRPQNGRTSFTSNVNSDENNSISSPRQNSFRSLNDRSLNDRSLNDRSLKPLSFNSPQSSTSDFDSISNEHKPLWNSSNPGQQRSQSLNSKSPPSNLHSTMTIDDHEGFAKNTIYNIYLSNLEVPNVVFVATLDDYVNATLLITQMNKHEQLTKIQANSYKTKLTVGEVCAAQFNGDWYRARVVEIGENRVRVQYIDWGNTGWCDTTLEIRPLPLEYFKDPALCVKCILDGVPTMTKLADDISNAILGILVLDLKLEMTVIRIENGIPYIRLHLGERNLNQEINQILPSPIANKSNQIIDFNSNRPQINPNELQCVQLTTVDSDSDCFYALLLHDHLVTIMNILKDWNATKQPITSPTKIGMLVCAQYDADDLWYRAWIKNLPNKEKNGYHVYFVDFGNEEIVSMDRLSECPESLRTIPWLAVRIKLANIKLTDNERCEILKVFETERLEMKILQKNQETYFVDLLNNGKSIVDYVLELRKNQPPPPPPPPPQIPVKTVESPSSNSIQPTHRPISVTNDVTKKPQSNTLDPISKPSSGDTINENLTILITEQRRQNRLLEQVLAAINTTNALLTQLVQR